MIGSSLQVGGLCVALFPVTMLRDSVGQERQVGIETSTYFQKP